MAASLGRPRDARTNRRCRPVTLREHGVNDSLVVRAGADADLTAVKADPAPPLRLRHPAAGPPVLMPTAVSHRRLWSGVVLSRNEVLRCLDAVAVVKQTAAQMGEWRPLQGRQLAMFCTAGCTAAEVMSRAVAAMGGHVALLSQGSWPSYGGNDLPDAARMLGQLYDAVDCCGLTPAAADQLERHAGVPVFDGLARVDHPMGLLGELATMREVSDRPLDQLQVRLEGDAQLPLHRAAVSLCRAAGIAVCGATGAPHAAGASPPPARTDFILNPCGPASAARLCATGATPREQARIVALLAENRLRTLQALIVMTLA
jgi:ornithine carbamoyltransferase